MARPLSKHPKHRREYVILTIDPDFGFRKFFVRTGYKSLLLQEFIKLFPYHDIKIFCLSDKVIHNIK